MVFYVLLRVSKLHKDDKKYRSFFENSADAMLIIEDGKFVDCNSATVLMLGYDRKEELINTPPFKLSPKFQPDGSSSIDKADEMMRLAREQGSHQFEWDHVRKDGSIIPVEVSLTAIETNHGSYLHTVWRDISERKQAEKALVQSREFLRQAQEIAHLGSWELNLDDNSLTWSDEAYRIFGFQPQEFQASYEAFLRTIHPDDRFAVNNAYFASLREERDTYEIEHRIIRRKSGEVRYVHEKCEHFRDQDGKIIRSVGMVHDITERKEREKEIQRLNTDLEFRADELMNANRELEAFNFTVAHDLRKPLTVINGYCEVLSTLSDNLDKQSLKYLQTIQDSTLRMSELIEALLDFSTLSRAEVCRKKMDLSSLAHEVVAELKMAEPGRNVTCLIQDGMQVDGDEVLLRVVMDNLIGNAWKFSNIRDEAIIEIGTTLINGSDACFVRDNGPGFDLTGKKELFAPFKRLKGSEDFQGFGIGLATVERIIHRHGGQVWAESEPDKGSTFYFVVGD
jgi:PAS domain S-box-containing protein